MRKNKLISSAARTRLSGQHQIAEKSFCPRSAIMLFYFSCPCLNLRVSCRSVGNNLPPFATEMAIARQTFEANRTIPSAIAKLSVGGLTVEHPTLVRKTVLHQAPHFTIQTCLLCNTKVCCTTSSGGSAVVNAKLSLTEVDMKKKLTDPRYCAAFRVLIVRRSSNNNSPSNASTNDQMNPEMLASLTAMVDTFVSQKELEAKRRVEVYYNEEQAKVRNMHRRLKRQMTSLTEQIVQVMEAEKVHQSSLQPQQKDGSPAWSVASSNSPDVAPASPLHKIPHVIHVPDSPKMDKSPRSSTNEQVTRDRFTAPLLAELDTHGDAIDSPLVGPAEGGGEESSERSQSANASASGGSSGSGAAAAAAAATTQDSVELKGDGTDGTPTSDVDSSNTSSSGSSGTSSGQHRKVLSSGSSGSGGSSNSDLFALTPPAIVGSLNSSGSRNLRDEEAKGRLRGIRMQRNKESDKDKLQQNMLISTTAPARSDVGFAHFVSSGVEDLFDMDEDLDVLYKLAVEEADRNGGGSGSGSALDGVVEGDEGEEEEEEGEEDTVSDLPGSSNRLKRDINWNASYKSSGLSQSYHAPPARDWWGEGVDESDSEEEEEESVAGAASADGVDVFNKAKLYVEPVVQPGVDMFATKTQPKTKTSGGGHKNAQFYGSSMPMAIPSMGGRNR